ncbi:hypothetical protein [Endozoicomonas lisbonensis]|uniref:Uncharacterized protein n=1 Tax=Endozoicomonas lisbonensis TaxID=3120522 RepID=A0ABV2SGX7_9GAMM
MEFVGLISLAGIALFICSWRAHKLQKTVAKIKPEYGKPGMLAGVALFFLAGGIGQVLMPEPVVKEKTVAMKSEKVEPAISAGSAVTEVLLAIPNSKNSVHNYRTGDLGEGIAVVINEHAGYWVTEDKVYAVNGIAKNMAPGADYTPADIDWFKVEQATQ